MNKNIKTLVCVALTALSLTFVGCSRNAEDNMTQETPQNTTQNTAVSDYEKYLVDRYDYYFNNEEVVKQYGMYNIYNDKFDYTGTYDEFITGYNEFYGSEKANLEAFKKDIETNYKKGDPEVDKLHEQTITSIDKSITAMDEYGTTFGEKTKDYGTLAKDEVVKGLKDIGRAPHDARMELDKLIQDTKARVGK